MRNSRLTMLGILCAGLLLCGIGAGVAFSEFSSFTYAGEQLITGAESCTQRLTLQLEQAEGPVLIDDYSRFSDLQDTAQIEVSEEVPPSTLLWEITYRSVGPEAVVWSDFSPEEDCQRLHFAWQNSSDLKLLLACKDQVLSDLRDHQLGEYLPVLLEEVVISVNPADIGRIRLS